MTSLPPTEFADAELTLKAGFVVAQRNAPYLGLALFKMKRVPTLTIDTMATDTQWRLLWNPTYVAALTADEAAAVLLHEINHLLRDHGHRFLRLSEPASRAPLWNVAADIAINHDLAIDGVILPGRYVTADQFPDELNITATDPAEVTYRTLTEQLPPEEPAGGCGSPAATGADLNNADANSVTGVDAGTADLVRRNVAADIAAYAASHGQGSVPAGLQRWANELLQPTVDWRRTLRSLVVRTLGQIAGQVDYSYTRVARRQVPGIIAPAMIAPHPPLIDIVVDTSQSISRDQLTQALTEVADIMRAYAVHHPVRVRWCDATASDATYITTVSLPHTFTTIEGGGGTDMAAGMRAAATDRPPANIIIVITDGRTDWPEQPPLRNAHYIAAIFDSPYPAPPIPDWIQHVSIPLPSHAQ